MLQYDDYKSHFYFNKNVRKFNIDYYREFSKMVVCVIFYKITKIDYFKQFYVVYICKIMELIRKLLAQHQNAKH